MPDNLASRIEAKLDLYAGRPAALANQVTRLKGSSGLLRLRVGDWRVIFEVTEAEIIVLTVSPRGSVYD